MRTSSGWCPASRSKRRPLLLRRGNQPLRLPAATQRRRVVGDPAGWTVEDLDQTMDELGSRGVRFEHYDQPGIKTDERGVFDGGDFRAVWIKDPDGNTMAITQFSS